MKVVLTKAKRAQPASGSLRAVGLLGTLKKTRDGPSNTEEVLKQLFVELAGRGVATSIIRLADLGLRSEKGLPIPRGSQREGIIRAVMEADIVVFATPIWWNSHSSLIQQVIEYLDDQDDLTLRWAHDHAASMGSDRSQGNRFLGKVGGVVVTGHEDGAQSVVSGILNFYHWVGITVPPLTSVTWVGEQGQPMGRDAEKRRKSPQVKAMIRQAAHNLSAAATLFRDRNIFI